jgi:hypothetical protein
MPASTRIFLAASHAVVLLAALLALLTAGCAATGTPASQMLDQLATVPANTGRIVFYREDTIVGAAIQPGIHLDGALVGESKPGGFFFSDVVPGTHRVSARTEVETAVSVTVGDGQTRYLRSAITIGVLAGHVQFTMVREDEARRQLPSMRFTGFALAGKPPRPAAPVPGTAAGGQAPTVSLDDLEALLPRTP